MSKPPFEEVVRRHGPMVLRVVRAVLGPHEAEDAWSEAFVAALRAYPALPEDADVEAWLVTIAHRKAIDSVRAAGRRAVPVAEPPDRPASTGRPEEYDPDLWRALRALPDRQRHAVAYHYLAGLPYQAIAELLGGTADAARRAAADGMKTLRRAYADPAGAGRAGTGAGGARQRTGPAAAGDSTLARARPAGGARRGTARHRDERRR
ncbi:RNA polymerase sigma factor [Actinacidiphila yeochonensis]|uniref:RNA polymerase sigma factor n=1 Tax=Actinacidiphila yeochonensis TaxID=89050 RepID=UPI000AB8C395|nr:sigma-70 family RNA polymerase sigma factor [Actinacidiphila yeochonensis]